MSQEAVPVVAAAVAMVAASRSVAVRARSVDRVRVRTKGKAAYDEIRARIVDRAIPPGTPINQRELASVLGISIIPLREALRRLEGEGLVESCPNNVMRVVPLPSREWEELLTVRAHLEALAVAIVARSADEGQRRTVVALASALAASRPGKWDSSHRAFHQAIYNITDNGILIESMKQLWLRIDRHPESAPPRAEQHADAARRHVVIAEYIQAGAEGLAADAVATHLTLAEAVRIAPLHDASISPSVAQR
ncbi:MAG TPA: GntR family transcriptional regulator [Candidatus Dormibacteraeota bacterium]|nr:GntR family transcriptional regulator [Candidatus Dormibacteraeota bacterium]